MTGSWFCAILQIRQWKGSSAGALVETVKEKTKQGIRLPVLITLHSVQLRTDTVLSLFSEALTKESLAAITPQMLQQVEKGEANCMLRGELTEQNGTITLSYDEPVENGMGATHTQVVFDIDSPGRVTVLRSGALSMAMVFEEGKRHVSFYSTDMFSFEVCTVTAQLRNALTLCGGVLDLAYFVEIRGADMEHTRLCIQVEPCQEDCVTSSYSKTIDQTEETQG